jgi:anti-anti-sigma regulatory factor
VICDVGGLASADAVAVNALARLQLTALRLGRRIQLRQASAELQALLALVGLSEILPPEPMRSGQMRRQAKQREQSGGIQEEGDAADPPVPEL